MPESPLRDLPGRAESGRPARVAPPCTASGGARDKGLSVSVPPAGRREEQQSWSQHEAHLNVCQGGTRVTAIRASSDHAPFRFLPRRPNGSFRSQGLNSGSSEAVPSSRAVTEDAPQPDPPCPWSPPSPFSGCPSSEDAHARPWERQPPSGEQRCPPSARCISWGSRVRRGCRWSPHAHPLPSPQLPAGPAADHSTCFAPLTSNSGVSAWCLMRLPLEKRALPSGTSDPPQGLPPERQRRASLHPRRRRRRNPGSECAATFPRSGGRTWRSRVPTHLLNAHADVAPRPTPQPSRRLAEADYNMDNGVTQASLQRGHADGHRVREQAIASPAARETPLRAAGRPGLRPGTREGASGAAGGSAGRRPRWGPRAGSSDAD